jgi:hypothetical protein
MVVNFESRPYLQYKNIIKNLDTYDKNISDRIHSMEIEPLKEKFVYLSARLFNPDFVAFYFVVIFTFKLFYLQ